MNIRLKFLVLISAVSVFATSQAKADTVVYDNGPINGTINAWTINYGFSVSDSFTVASDTTLTLATVGLWSAGNPLSVSWSIGTAAFGSEISSGVASLSNSLLGSHDGNSIYESSFAINGWVGSGTYYLTLGNASASGEAAVYWDENDGSSTAQQSLSGNPVESPDGSQAFKLYGAGSVPDSGATLALLGGALLSLAAFRRRLVA